ncbi:unnamed protein product [Polarella glacialis]|uniref:Uncharacterized protein n=1 Tax=Polarella glacialis TaxID=89957 RepID=A0A813EHU0_POLGL|nr:unnamed protein product [Polarella glacialis]CAE8598498.1 unnamed protein product [Polarella glacialis]CAE8655836.1 unnamed protein product [Polarella glacialis]
MGQSLVLGVCEAPVPGQARRPRQLGGDLLRGELEIAGSAAVGASTRLAVAEALAMVVFRSAPKGASSPSHVEVTRSPLRPDSAPGSLRFAYAVRFADVDSACLARKALECEAACGGRHRLLPRFALALAAHGQEPVVDPLALQIVDFTVESLVVPGKGEGIGSRPEDLVALASFAGATLVESCLLPPCNDGLYDRDALDKGPSARSRRRALPPLDSASLGSELAEVVAAL